MINRILVVLIFCIMTGGMAHAQDLSTEDPALEEEEGSEEEESLTEQLEDATFWTQEVDSKEEWGIWLKEVYKPYADKMTVAMLKIVASTADIDPAGKSTEELMEEVNAAYTRSLRSMEMISPPVELKVYHSKVIELYRQTIKADPLADPQEAEQHALVIGQLSREVDRAMTRALKLHAVPERVIRYILRN